MTNGVASLVDRRRWCSSRLKNTALNKEEDLDAVGGGTTLATGLDNTTCVWMAAILVSNELSNKWPTHIKSLGRYW